MISQKVIAASAHISPRRDFVEQIPEDFTWLSDEARVERKPCAELPGADDDDRGKKGLNHAHPPSPAQTCSLNRSRCKRACSSANPSQSGTDKTLRGRGSDTVTTSAMRPGRGRQDNDDVGQRDGLDDIVRHKDHRVFHVLPKLRQLLLQTETRMRIQRPERLIHQQDRLVGDERPRQRAPLLHPAGKLARKLVLETAKLHPLDPVHRPAAALGGERTPAIFSGNSMLASNVIQGNRPRPCGT